MKRVFVDTSAFFALIDKTDRNHQEALQLAEKIRQERLELVISDHILAETITLVRGKIGFQEASFIGKRMFDSEITTLVIANEKALKNAWDIFLKYSDKDFSFVDCISFGIMEHEKINLAFTFDHHFEAIGFKILKEK